MPDALLEIVQGGHGQRVKRLKTRQALVPPKPKELDMTTFTWAFRAVFGT
jgi:hypothetical protein